MARFVELGLKLSKEWGPTIAKLAVAPALMKKLEMQIIKREAEFFRKKIVEGLREQAPGGVPFKPLNPWTIATRRLLGVGGNKALIERADLMRSIGLVQIDKDTVAVGVLPGSVNSEGRDLVKIAQVQEHGAGPIMIPISVKMRRFLAMIARKLNKTPPPARGAKKGYIIVHVPARPFLAPVFRKYGHGAQMVQRMDDHLSVLLRGLNW